MRKARRAKSSPVKRGPNLPLKPSAVALEEELASKRAKHEMVQWLVSGNRRVIPPDIQKFIQSHPEEARALFDYFRKRARRRPKGKKHLFSK